MMKTPSTSMHSTTSTSSNGTPSGRAQRAYHRTPRMSSTRLLKAVRSGNKDEVILNIDMNIEGIPEDEEQEDTTKLDTNDDEGASAAATELSDIDTASSSSRIVGGGGRRGLQRAGTGKRFMYIVDSKGPVPVPVIVNADATTSTPNDKDTAPKDDSQATTFRSNAMQRAMASRRTGTSTLFIQTNQQEQHVLAKKLQQMHLNLDRATIDATTVEHTAELNQVEEYLDIISNLEDINKQNQQNIQTLTRQLNQDEVRMQTIESNYNTQLTQLQSQKEHDKAELLDWRTRHQGVTEQNYTLIEKMASKYASQLDELEQEKGAHVDKWKGRYQDMGTLYDELLVKVNDMAEENGKLLYKCQQFDQEKAKQSKLESDRRQLQSDNEVLQAHADEWKKKHEIMEQINEEIVGKMCGLSEENDQLLLQCQQLEFEGAKKDASMAIHTMETLRETVTEDSVGGRGGEGRGSKMERVSFAGQDGAMSDMEREEALQVIETLALENDTLHQSMEEAMDLANDMNIKMNTFVGAHEMSVQAYEEKIASLRDELKEATLLKEEYSIGLKLCNEENRTLHTDLDNYERVIVELTAGRNFAYQKCEVLQQEIAFLKQRLALRGDSNK